MLHITISQRNLIVNFQEFIPSGVLPFVDIPWIAKLYFVLLIFIASSHLSGLLPVMDVHEPDPDQIVEL